MFTLTDVCNIAVQIEQNGETAYRQAAQMISNSSRAQILNWMADEEQRHAKWFESMAGEQTDRTDHHEMKEMGRALLQEMMKDQTFDLKSEALASEDGLAALLNQSIEFERDTITFYEMLSDFVEDGDVRRQLSMIIKEEQGHIRNLERLKHN